jgi:hypothetical protein
VADPVLLPLSAINFLWDNHVRITPIFVPRRQRLVAAFVQITVMALPLNNHLEGDAPKGIPDAFPAEMKGHRANGHTLILLHGAGLTRRVVTPVASPSSARSNKGMISNNVSYQKLQHGSE